MENKLDHIITESNHLFLRNGIKSTTMDDVARHLAISKKTLYKYLTDKNDLVTRVLNQTCNFNERITQDICKRGLNAIDESFEISNYVTEQLSSVHPSIHYDLEKYHPVAWHAFMKRQQKMVYECQMENMEKGVKEGYYRDDLNASIVAKIYISRMDICFNSEIFPTPDYKFAEVYEELFRYHIRGIASERGMKYLTQKFNQKKLEPR